MTTPRNWGPGHPSYPRAKPSSTKLDEMRAYVASMADLDRDGVGPECLRLALAAIDEARAEERARCATMRRPYVPLDWPRFNAVYDLATALFGWLPGADTKTEGRTT